MKEISNTANHGLRLMVFAGLLLIMLSACATLPEQPAPGAQPVELTPLPSPTAYPAPQEPPASPTWEARPIATPPAGLELAPTREDPLQGEAPRDIMDDVLQDAMQRSGAGLESITVLRAEAVEWPDGSLGCPSPGVEYLQVVTPGYWIELQIGDIKYDYRATQSGNFRLCENALPVKP